MLRQSIPVLCKKRAILRTDCLMAPCLTNNSFLGSIRSYFEDKYNTEEYNKVLSILNVTKEQEFGKYVISRKRIGQLIKLREEKGGTFKGLDELLPIMGTRVLEKFYGSMLDKRSLGMGNPMIPTLTTDQISNYSSVLTFSITGNNVSWCLLRREFQEQLFLSLDSLQLRTFDLLPKPHFLHVLRQMIELGEELPPCDLCLCEEFPSAVPSPYMFNFHLQMTQARSMVLAHLASKSNNRPAQIATIKTIAVARLFNTYVGSEKVSGQHVVDSLFEYGKNLRMKPQQRDSYLDADSQTKECLSNVFLTNLAYWKLTRQFD